MKRNRKTAEDFYIGSWMSSYSGNDFLAWWQAYQKDPAAVLEQGGHTYRRVVAKCRLCARGQAGWLVMAEWEGNFGIGTLMEDETGRVFSVAGFEMIRLAEELREMHMHCLPEAK